MSTRLDGLVNLSGTSFRRSRGMAELEYDGRMHTLTVISVTGEVLASFPAYNTTTTSSNGPWPNGSYDYSHYNPHHESGPNGPYGSHGIFVFSVPGRTGMGVHSGRANRGGPAHATLGCIRTTDMAIEFLNSLQDIDPLAAITVANNDPNAPQQAGGQ